METKLVGGVADGSCCPVSGREHIALAGGQDLSGDGLDDVLVGLPSAGAYLVEVREHGDVLIQSESHAEVTGSYTVGYAMSPAGDTNGDGIKELLVGAPLWTTGVNEYGLEGSAYLLSAPLTGQVDIETSADARLRGEDASVATACNQVAHWTCWSLAGLGDTNGDGLDDIIVGASDKAYLLLGPVVGDIDLRTDADIRWLEVSSLFGDIVVAPGDLNGDGLADVLIADPKAIWFGPVVRAGSRDDADASFVGGCESYAVSAGGDVNGDGHRDLLLGWGGDSEGGEYAGIVYIATGPFSSDRDLCADQKVVGESAFDSAGTSVGSAGDVDGDGFSDILVGAQAAGGAGNHTGNAPGSAFVLFGPVTATSLADADIILRGEGDDEFGYAVAGVGDVDGDGLGDIAIGGPGDDEGATEAGAAWIFYGSDLSSYH